MPPVVASISTGALAAEATAWLVVRPLNRRARVKRARETKGAGSTDAETWVTHDHVAPSTGSTAFSEAESAVLSRPAADLAKLSSGLPPGWQVLHSAAAFGFSLWQAATAGRFWDCRALNLDLVKECACSQICSSATDPSPCGVLNGNASIVPYMCVRCTLLFLPISCRRSATKHQETCTGERCDE